MPKTSSLRSLLRNRRGYRLLQQKLRSIASTLLPAAIALSFATVAHAQGTMDFSGAQTLMGTFKAKNPLILGFQGKAQLEMIYGHLAEVMLSQPATKIFLKTTEPKAAEWVSNAIGKVEIERLRETHSTGLRAGNNFSVERQVEPLVLDSEISGLPDRHAFLKHGNHVARFSFAYNDIPATQPAFLPRPLEDDDLAFDPKTLAKKPPRSAEALDGSDSEDESMQAGFSLGD